MATGVMVLKRRPLGYTLAPIFILFLLLIGLPILLTPVVEAFRGQPGSWGVTVPIGSLTLALLGLLTWLLSTMRRPGISAFMKPVD